MKILSTTALLSVSGGTQYCCDRAEALETMINRMFITGSVITGAAVGAFGGAMALTAESSAITIASLGQYTAIGAGVGLMTGLAFMIPAGLFLSVMADALYGPELL